MKKIMVLVLVSVSLQAKKAPNVVDKYINPVTSTQAQPNQAKGKERYAKLREGISDGYGAIIKKQATICQDMATVNSTIVEQLEILFTRCSASQKCLLNHKNDMVLFEKQLDEFSKILKEYLKKLQNVQLAPNT
jgi:hypothetical protein